MRQLAQVNPRYLRLIFRCVLRAGADLSEDVPAGALSTFARSSRTMMFDGELGMHRRRTLHRHLAGPIPGIRLGHVSRLALWLFIKNIYSAASILRAFAMRG